MPDAPSTRKAPIIFFAILLGYHWLGKTTLSIHNFAMPLAKRGWKDNDFNRGIQYAIEMGWVTTRSPASFSLTDIGLPKPVQLRLKRRGCGEPFELMHPLPFSPYRCVDP